MLLRDTIQEKVDEKKVTQMVRLEVTFNPIYSLLPWHRHDGRIPDDPIDGDIELPDFFGCLADGGKISKISLDE